MRGPQAWILDTADVPVSTYGHRREHRRPHPRANHWPRWPRHLLDSQTPLLQTRFELHLPPALPRARPGAWRPLSGTVSCRLESSSDPLP